MYCNTLPLVLFRLFLNVILNGLPNDLAARLVSDCGLALLIVYSFSNWFQKNIKRQDKVLITDY